MATLFATKTGRRARKAGRKGGSRNLGYFYRNGRGWVAGPSKSPLYDELGHRLTNPADKKRAEAAYRKWLDAQAIEARNEPGQMSTPIGTLCQMFLERCEKEIRSTTFEKWAGLLFDFCEGAFPRYRTKWATMSPAQRSAARAETRKACEAAGGKYVSGFGEMEAGKLKIFHVTAWANAHPGWISPDSKRAGRTALKQCFAYAVQQGVIEENPIAKLKVGGTSARITYFTPQQESAVLRHASTEYAELFLFCIRTGARCGEFATLEARHVKIETTKDGKQMTGTLAPHEHKSGSRTGKDRVIRTKDAEVIEMVETAIEQRPTGKLFRSHRNRPWNNGTICSAWKNVRNHLAAAGIDITCEGKRCSTHTTRHTFAKRELWERGKSPQSVAIRMGDTVEMVLKVYGKFINALEQTIWDDV